MRKKLTALFLSLVLLGLTACQQPTAPTEPTQEQPASLQGMYDGFMDAVSPDFAYDIALELTTNPPPWWWTTRWRWTPGPPTM